MIRMIILAVLAMIAPARANAEEPSRASVTILISIDGFRADYLDRGITPRLSELAANGARGVMRPSFPSVTFPNHYTLVTGYHPDTHGIVSNRMEDPEHPGMTFTMASAEPFWWDKYEPLWITAQDQGVRTATMFWPGSNIAYGGKRPADWHAYAEDVTATQRVDGIIDWLRRPAATRPKFLTLYFDTVDTAGHKYGPVDPRTDAAIADVDAAIARLSDELAALGQPANLVIVADHGMAATSPDRVIKLYEIANPADYRLVYGGAYGAIEPVAGREQALAAALLKPHPHMVCHRKADLPPALYYGQHPRVPPFVCLVESGWLLSGAPPAPDRPVTAGGAHGYDPANADMAAIFIAHGPQIKSAQRVAPFDNVDIYVFLAQLINVVPMPHEGEIATLAGIIR